MMKIHFYFFFLPGLLYAIRYGDILNLTPSILAKSFSILASMDAMSGLLFPATAFSWVGLHITPHSAADYHSRILGTRAAMLALMSYLAVSSTDVTTPVKAVAASHGIRATGAVWLGLSGRGGEVGVRKIYIVGVVVLHLTALAIMWQDLYGVAVLCGRLFAGGMSLGGIIGMLFPDSTAKCVLGSDIKDKPAHLVAQFSGLYLFLNGLYANLILHDVDPIKAAGWTSLATVPFVHSVQQIEDIKGFCGLSKEVMVMGIVTILGAITAGTLL